MATGSGPGSVAERFRGLVAPIPAVFDGKGEVDVATQKQLTDWYIDKGVDGFFVLGAQGQGPACRSDQRKAVAEAVLGQVNGTIPAVIQAGAGAARTPRGDPTHAAHAVAVKDRDATRHFARKKVGTPA